MIYAHAHASANQKAANQLKICQKHLEDRKLVQLGKWHTSPHGNERSSRASFQRPARSIKGKKNVMNAGFGLQKWREKQLQLIQRKSFFQAGVSAMHMRRGSTHTGETPVFNPTATSSPAGKAALVAQQSGEYDVDWSHPQRHSHRRIRSRPGTGSDLSQHPPHSPLDSSARRTPQPPPDRNSSHSNSQGTGTTGRYSRNATVSFSMRSERSDSLYSKRENERLREYGEQVLAQQTYEIPPAAWSSRTNVKPSFYSKGYSSGEDGFQQTSRNSLEGSGTDMLRMSPCTLESNSHPSLESSENCSQASGITLFFPRISQLDEHSTEDPATPGPLSQATEPAKIHRDDKSIFSASLRSQFTEDEASRVGQLQSLVGTDSDAARVGSNETIKELESTAPDSRENSQENIERKYEDQPILNKSNRGSKKANKDKKSLPKSQSESIKKKTGNESSTSTSVEEDTVENDNSTKESVDAEEMRKLFNVAGLSAEEHLALMNQESSLVATFETDSLAISESLLAEQEARLLSSSKDAGLNGQPQNASMKLELSNDESINTAPVVPPPSVVEDANDAFTNAFNPSLLSWREIVLCEALKQLNTKHQDRKFDVRNVLYPAEKDGTVVVILPQDQLLQPGIPRISTMLDCAIILRVDEGELFENFHNVVYDMALEAMSFDTFDPEHSPAISLQFFHPGIMKWLPLNSRPAWGQALAAADSLRAGSILMVYSFLLEGGWGSPRGPDGNRAETMFPSTKMDFPSTPAPVSPEESAKKKRYLAEQMLVRLKYGYKSKPKQYNKLKQKRMPVLKKSIMFGSSNLSTDVWNS